MLKKEIAVYFEKSMDPAQKMLSLLVINSQKFRFHCVNWELVSSVVMPFSCVVVHLSCSVAVLCSPSVKKLAQAHV